MKYIIHRGITSSSIKENSYLAIKKALGDPSSSGVEFDIRLTKDKRIVLSHNSLVHLNSSIENLNYNDIIKYTYLTTLDKILEIDSNKIMLIDVKIKNNYKVFGDVLTKYLKDINKNIYIASFDRRFIRYLKKKNKYKCGVIYIYYRRNNYKFSLINYKFITNKRIKKINNKEIFLWTISNNNDLNIVKEKFSNYNDYFIIMDKKI